MNVASGRNLSAAARCSSPLAGDTCRSTRPPLTTSSPHAGWDLQSKSPGSDKSSPSKYSDKDNMEDNMENGTDYGFLVRQNSELLQALDVLEKTCTNLREENSLLRKSSVPETEEKVRRLRRKNTELAVIAKRLEDRARKLQEANLKVVNAPAPVRPGAVEQYKRAFARQRARDLAQHADTLLYKDKEIAALQQECRQLETRLGTAKGCPVPSGVVEFERLLRESQKEVLRLQRQLSVSSSRVTSKETFSKGTSCREHNGHDRPCTPEEKRKENVAAETPCVALDEAPSRCEETPREEEGPRVIPTPPGPAPTQSHSHQKEHREDQRLQLLECELSKKRKECENLEHEVRKRQKGCLDLESQLEDERGKNGHLEEEANLLRRKARLLDQTWVENEELREHLSEVTAQRDSVLEENQRLRAKLENLEQVLKHMREVAERRQQLELEHEQALAILKFKQDEIKRLQRAEFFAKREHEGVVQLLEDLIQLVLQRELSKVRELEDKCRSQSEQFGLLSHELETFRLQAGKLDLAGSALLTNRAFCHLTNGVGLAGDVAATLQMGATPHAAGLTRSPTVKHRELPTISLTKSSSTPKSASDTTHLSPKSAESHHSPHHSPRRTSPTPHEVDTASEVEELDIDVSPAPYTALRGAAQLQVFIARYSYNPYDGPNDNPEVELPLTAGEYIYVYGGMDDDGFYEGELMDGRRGLVPSNFVERISDDDMISAHVPEGTDISHNSLLDSSLHSASHQHHLCLGGPGTSERTDPTSAASVPVSLSVPSGEQVPSDPSLPDLLSPAPLTNGLDLDLEVGLGTVPYPRKLTLIKQLAKSIIISWDGPLVPAGWGNVWSYNVYVDQELRLNVPFGSQTKAVLERLDVTLKAYRVSVQSLTERGSSDQLRCSLLVGRDVCVAPTQLRVDRVTATSASLAWLPSNSNYVHVVSLNEEEMELVKAGSYSLCLSNLTPSLQYTVKVEAQPHQTPWEIPQERREHKTATTTFTTLAAGPPDAPLDVQLEQGPSPGIALISWLPVTIDAAGTSNGVRVTGYTIYADKKKVLEVSSPTAGSALMGPSQIQSLMAAHELTVRTMSAHGESIDSVPVNVPAKLSDIMTGQASAASCSSSTPVRQSTPVHQSPPYQSPPVHQSTPVHQSPPYLSPPVRQLTPVHQSPPVHQSSPYQSPPFLSSSPPVQPQSPSYGNSAAKVSMLPYATASSPLDVAHAMGPNWGPPSANSPPVHALHTEACSPHPASYAEVWANPLAKSPVPPWAALAVHEAMSSPVALNYQAKLPSASHINTTSPHLGPVAATEQSRADTGSPGVPRPVMSITDFLPVEDDSRANLSTPEPYPTPPKALVPHARDLINPLDTQPLRPPRAPSPLESEPDYSMERPTTRLVSMEDFLRQDQDTGFNRQPQRYTAGPVEPESSRGSDLSDILEEEEDELYSDPPGPALARGYTTGANREAGAGWSGQPGSPKLTRSEVIHQLKESMDHAWPVGDNEVRIFVALFPYDPVNMSPNPDAAEEELPFREGQIIKIYGDKDSDGFYRGESNGRHGYVPCNMVSEIQVEDEETRETLLQQGFLSTATNMEKIDPSQSDVATANPAGPGPRRMKAIFDYDPRESSPNADIEVELTFSAGDIIYVFGDMDDDGFFYGDLNGHKGLVPSNFLQAAPEAAGKAPPFEPQSVAEHRTESQVSLSTFSEEVLHPPLHTGLTGPVHTHPPLHTGLTGPVHTHPPLHTGLTGPVHTHPPLHTGLTGPVHTHPPLHTGLTGPVHTHPPLHTGLTGPVHTDHQHHLDPSAAAAMMEPSSMDPAPTPRQASLSSSPPHIPAESPSQTDQTDVSPPGKKKKGFFSKGKKLFKKLGSSKKD
ncbi:RIMS-binding protein 2 isoform X3 [Salmo trutta]|uniref:RIMS-binding protein 2 isoform X3 n=1 Tax=Salmo trutta TaxID=8032 RepID=UPI001131740D|nr:peripheral-type benzodiazepine receptor-associated protein 1 isoform X3 [Salmo trutta]